MKKNLKKPIRPDKFQFNNAILVEGKDDLEFIVSFLKKLTIQLKDQCIIQTINRLYVNLRLNVQF